MKKIDWWKRYALHIITILSIHISLLFPTHLYSQFFKFALTFCNELVALGYWADYIDPNSGLPVSSLC
jgi:hypothetical protein